MDKDLLGENVNPNELAFDTLWEVKPKREGDNSKQEARRSFFRLLTQGFDVDQIIAAARQWAEQTKNVRDRRTIPMVSTWLNQRRFEGENYDQPKSQTQKDQIAAFMTAKGWHWDGSRWVNPTRGRDDDLKQRRASLPPLSLEQKANLFVAADLPWYASMVEMHRASDGTQSYFGKSENKQQSGIWVPKHWYDEYRTAQRMNFSDVNPVKAREITEESAASPPAADTTASMKAPGEERPKKTMSWDEEANQDFGG